MVHVELSPAHHTMSMCPLTHHLQIRDNLGISVDNQSSLPQPVFIPPLLILASWMFKVREGLVWAI